MGPCLPHVRHGRGRAGATVRTSAADVDLEKYEYPISTRSSWRRARVDDIRALPRYGEWREADVRCDRVGELEQPRYRRFGFGSGIHGEPFEGLAPSHQDGGYVDIPTGPGRVLFSVATTTLYHAVPAPLEVFVP